MDERPKILFIEQADAPLQVLRDFLHRTCDMETVADAGQARRLASKHGYAVVLSDRGFENGWDAALYLVAVDAADAERVRLSVEHGGEEVFRGEASYAFFEALLRYGIERQRLLQQRNDHIGTVSHELRTPLTIIEEAVSQVVDGILGELNEDQRETLELSLKSVHRLARIVNDLLDISKIEAGKVVLQKEKTDLCAIIKDVQRSFMATAEKRGLSISVHAPDCPVELYIDKDKMTQVFTNLVGNALKFTEKGSVDLYLTDCGEGVECAVVDTGRGISQEDLPGVFNRFEQCGQRAVDGQKGTGLGLAISKGLVELHRGSMRVESALGKGTRFIFNLPRGSQKEAITDVIAQQLRIAKSFNQALSVVVYRCTQGSAELGRPVAEVLNALLRQISAVLRVKMDSVYCDEHSVYIVLPETDAQQAEEVGERLQIHIASLAASIELELDKVIRRYTTTYPVVSDEGQFLHRIFEPEGAAKHDGRD